MDDRFKVAGIRPIMQLPPVRARWYRGKPIASITMLIILAAGCLLISGEPAYMDLRHTNIAPNRVFWFGTDAMGRDLFSMAWHGGRVSLFIGVFAAAVSALVAIVFGVVSGLAPKWLDSLMMRLADIVLSIPNLLVIVLLQAVFGKANILSMAIVIGITGWVGIAKVVRMEVLQIRNSGYVLAARCMGAGFFRILWWHLTPNFLSSIMFMVVMNIRSAIVIESTLSFMGMGLPLESVSWGSMLSLADRGLTSGAWWVIVVPGVFLVTAILCITNIGEFLANRNLSHHV